MCVYVSFKIELEARGKILYRRYRECSVYFDYSWITAELSVFEIHCSVSFFYKILINFLLMSKCLVRSLILPCLSFECLLRASLLYKLNYSLSLGLLNFKIFRIGSLCVCVCNACAFGIHFSFFSCYRSLFFVCGLFKLPLCFILPPYSYHCVNRHKGN